MKRANHHPRQRGFTLIVTMMLLVLIALLAVGLLTLSSVSLRTSERSSDHATARANARLALMLAIGQLQENLGPDQRVSASASIFDSSPSSPAIEGVLHPSTVGVWSTLDKAGASLIDRDSTDGFLKDRRNGEINHRENVQAWLISKHESFDPRTSILGSDNSIVLAKTNPSSSGTSEVRAPIVTTSNGGYAYHTADLGTMAPLYQHNPLVTQKPNAATPQDGGYDNLYGGTKRPYEKFAETTAALASISSDEAVSDPQLSSKYITLASMRFSPSGDANANFPTLMQNFGNDFCLTNTALFTDTLTGQLRIDLTGYLRDSSKQIDTKIQDNSGATVIADQDPMISASKFRTFSPKFGALRNYVQLGNEAGTNRSAKPQAPLIGGGKFGVYPDPTKKIKQSLHPLITEFSVYHAVAPDPNATTTGLSLLYFPRITLWNPYDVTIDVANYIVQINERAAWYVDLLKKDGTLTFYGYYLYSSWFTNVLANDGTFARELSLIFNLAPTKLEPGQSLVFTAPSGTSQLLEKRSGNIGKNILTPFNDIQNTNLGFYYYPFESLHNNTSSKYTTATYTDQYILRRVDRIGSQAGMQAILRLNKSGGTVASYASIAGNQTGSSPNYPILHTFDIANGTDFLEGNGYSRMLTATTDLRRLCSLNPAAQTSIPHNRMKFGGRLKAFAEIASNTGNHPNALWRYPLLESANLRSSLFRRFPWDSPIASLTKTIEVNRPDQISFGPFTTEEIDQPAYSSSFMVPRYNAIAESSPFMNSQSYGDELRFILFNIPPANAEILNFAQLRNAALTDEISAPTFIIGESLATIAAPRNQSAYSRAPYAKDWWNGFSKKELLHTDHVSAWWQPEFDPDKNYSAFDYRFETNHALWDRFFLSTLPANASLSAYTAPGALPHKGIFAEASDSHRLNDPAQNSAVNAAKHLRLRNHLSVNSTSVMAWKALLSMNLGLSIDGKDTDANSVPFPNIISSTQGGTNSSTPDDPANWNGYRQLSQEEIDALANQLVSQVKQRAPFISISDFVNRRLMDGPPPGTSPDAQSEKDLLSYAGPLEIAIQKAGINKEDTKIGAASSYAKPYQNAPEPITANMPIHPYAGTPSYLTQGKILQTIGSLLTARSDTFKIRAYGEARDAAGKVTARARCEAIIQRTIDYIVPSADAPQIPAKQLTSAINQKFGRRMKITSFQWLTAQE